MFILALLSQQLQLWHLLLLVLIVSGIVLWLINQIHIIRERHKKGLTKLSDKKLEETIQDWLDIPNLARTRKTNEETLFQFDVQAPSGIPVTIKRRKVDPFFFHFGVVITWNNENKVKINALKEPFLSTLLSDIKIEMARLGIQHSGIIHPLNEILLIDSTPIDDSLTRYDFLQHIFFVIRASSLVAALIERTLISSKVSALTVDKEGSQS